MAVANKGAKTARGLGATQPEGTLCCCGATAAGAQKKAGLQGCIHPFESCPRFRSKGTGAQEAVISTIQDSACCILMCCQVCDGATYLPSRPAGLSEVQAENSREDQGRIGGGDKKPFSNLASKQNKFKETKP